MQCPLCNCQDSEFFWSDKRRSYQQCQQCKLIFVPEQFWLTEQQEKAIYDTHQNQVDDLGYRSFLNRVAQPVLSRLSLGMKGLDFGCGPGPALAAMFEESGFKVALYDLFYYPDKQVLCKQYDFVTCTEVIEHIQNPDKAWQTLLSLLKPKGTLAIMTKLSLGKERFAQWHYKNDPTHIAFYSRATFNFLAQRDNLKVEYVGADVILIERP